MITILRTVIARFSQTVLRVGLDLFNQDPNLSLNQPVSVTVLLNKTESVSNKFQLYFFSKIFFGSSKPWIRIRIQLKYWIRIRIRIRIQ
jgi:hypothetical protein